MENLQNIENFIRENKYAILYFGTESCSVCHGLKPQVQKLLSEYPMVKEKFVWVDDVNEIRGQFQLFTFPVLIMYVDGKEFFRVAKFVPIVELKEKLDRIMEFSN